MANQHGPWWAQAWWSRRTTTVNIAIVVVLTVFVLWMAVFR
jgi:hypothetical protein